MNPSVTAARTIMFLDLSKFTALTDVHGDATAVELVDHFTDAVRAAVAGQGRIVKTMGDGVLLDMSSPSAAIEAAGAVSKAMHVLPGMLDLAGGISTGPVIDRHGDVLGSTVNLASRLATLAPAGELRVTGPAARAAARGGWQVEPLGHVAVRGFHEPIDAFAVVFLRPSGYAVDVVCGMRMTPGPATPTVEWEGSTWSFCSPGCLGRFRESPHAYVGEHKA